MNDLRPVSGSTITLTGNTAVASLSTNLSNSLIMESFPYTSTATDSLNVGAEGESHIEAMLHSNVLKVIKKVEYEVLCSQHNPVRYFFLLHLFHF